MKVKLNKDMAFVVNNVFNFFLSIKVFLVVFCGFFLSKKDEFVGIISCKRCEWPLPNTIFH